jgi:hypothetical protein
MFRGGHGSHLSACFGSLLRMAGNRHCEAANRRQGLPGNSRRTGEPCNARLRELRYEADREGPRVVIPYFLGANGIRASSGT